MNPRGNRNEHGASIIEFGLVAFVFFMILWGIFEFAHAFYVRNTTQHLTRCIAREAVVMKPSWTSLAKESCLLEMQNEPGEHYWPFYQLQPEDMKDLFVVRYHFLNPTANPRYRDGPLSASQYDNQLEECAGGTDRCVSYVQVFVPAGTLEEFGLLRVWLSSMGNANEPFASTMMPAESMGYAPP